MTLPAMLDDLPTDCDVGMKKDSKGYQSTWVGYKLHLDVADGQIPISWGAVRRRHSSAGANPARQLSCVDASENASPFCVSSFVRDNGAAPPAPRLRRWNTGQLPSWPATSFPHGRPRQSPRGPERSGGPAPAG